MTATTMAATDIEWVAAVLALSKFAHVFVVAGLLVIAYRWSRRYSDNSAEARRRSPPKKG